MSIQSLAQRKDIPTQDTWKLEDMFENDTLVEEKLKEVQNALQDFSVFKGKVCTSSSSLLEVLTLQNKVSMLAEKIYVYTHMRLHQDTSNNFYQDLANRSENLLVALRSATSFIEPELSMLSLEDFEKLIKEEDGLKLYERFFSEIIRQKPHILDSTLEQLLSEFSEITSAPSNIFSMYNNADIKFPVIEDEKGEKVQITHGRYAQLLENRSQKVREATFKGVYASYTSMKNTLATTFAANVKQYGLMAKVRHFESPLHAALNAHNIPVAVYDNLISTVHQNLDGMYDYIELRKSMLGFDTLHMYDLYMPIVNEFDKKISYEEACSVILKALAPLGEDYIRLIQKGFDERWVDKFENEGKRSGAYSWGTYDAPHPYVLMNYVDNVNNMFTLAHEMGHALHSYLSSHTQPYIYAGYCIFVAEVASTVNEALLMQYLLKTTTDKVYRKYLINYFMEQFRTTLYRQTMFAEFEKTVHLMNQRGESLTADTLCSIYYELVKTYHGETMTVDDEIAMEWARIPHFYTPFYVYQYATGYSAAIALSQRILTGGSEAVEAYKNFLKGGSSKDPIELLKIAGVDMSSPSPIEAALKVFKGLIDEMKTIQAM